ncbi:MAG: hypothetical protein COC19_02000 [SAR86 cluster bacterium]|uniref:SOS cell division inhibitor SulA n=1 Tax=SAR86 cluster bacterium TaxID=2030880 RepID=A0A2A4MTA9_9GAMM|nr:MAG: hypothetical protein COC19_02000 [SAR86 cluster bacterium]
MTSASFQPSILPGENIHRSYSPARLSHNRVFSQAPYQTQLFSSPSDPSEHCHVDNSLSSCAWPDGSMVQICSTNWGIGELELVLPTMRSAIAKGKWILWLSPPDLLDPSQLTSSGINMQYVFPMQLDTSCEDALSTLEHALQSDSCGLVLIWQNWLPTNVVKRLQRAAKAGNTLGVLFQNSSSKHSHTSIPFNISI